LETLKRWTQAIPFIDLSQSIQDAISVTRQLGIPFLWVDSLCIIQDDPDDRAKEIAKMPQIYKKAYCTISTASAGASHQGFLQSREGSKDRRHMVYRNMMNLWSDIVQDFTTRKLSVASDRPLANSGLAGRYGKIIGGKYLAGLWERNLVNGLLWRRASSFKGPRQRSPSWSWTSIDGKVDW
jgi:Heterokaryon incompatibility protein (HET)